jgi:hypothetical protein
MKANIQSMLCENGLNGEAHQYIMKIMGGCQCGVINNGWLAK